MSFRMSGSPQRWLTAALAGAALLGCGGGGGPEQPSAQNFGQRAQALATQGGSNAPRALSPAHSAEVQRRSREWAVDAIYSATASTGSVVAVPPLYFGFAFAVDAAAHGDTLDALRARLPAAEPAVQAALQHGVARSVRASATATFEPAFLDALTAQSEPGTWAALTLSPLTPQQLAAEPHLRMAISDRASGSWAWPQASTYEGVHRFANGTSIKVPMLRVQGPVLAQVGDGYTASSMAVGNGHWLVRVVPSGTPAAFGAAGLTAALAAVVPTLTAQAASTAATGSWQLPATSTTNTAGLGDRRGMALALNPAIADLRGMDSGGSYLAASGGGGGSLAVEAAGVSYWASHSFEFIFNPQNIFNPGWSGSVQTQWINFPVPPACPTEPADVRPYFLALVQPGGNVAMLGRLDSYRSEACA